MNKTLIVITGPSASGKSTLERALCGKDSPFARVRSVTTRPPRAGERNGVDYDFVDYETFMRMQTDGELLGPNQFGAYHYGAAIERFDEIFMASKIAVLVADPNGRRQIEAAVPDLGWELVRVYVTNPAVVRMQRLIDRFIEEIEHLELGGEHFLKRKQGFAQRLALVTEEEGLWDNEAFGPNVLSPYELRFRHFAAENKDQVVQRVADYAMSWAFGPNVKALLTKKEA